MWVLIFLIVGEFFRLPFHWGHELLHHSFPPKLFGCVCEKQCRKLRVVTDRTPSWRMIKWRFITAAVCWISRWSVNVKTWQMAKHSHYMILWDRIFCHSCSYFVFCCDNCAVKSRNTVFTLQSNPTGVCDWITQHLAGWCSVLAKVWFKLSFMARAPYSVPLDWPLSWELKSVWMQP